MTNAIRTWIGSRPRWRANPAATPPSSRSSVLRNALGGRDARSAGGTGVLLIVDPSSHSARSSTMSADPVRTLVHGALPGVGTRGSPDGAHPCQAPGLLA